MLLTVWILARVPSGRSLLILYWIACGDKYTTRAANSPQHLEIRQDGRFTGNGHSFLQENRRRKLNTPIPPNGLIMDEWHGGEESLAQIQQQKPLVVKQQHATLSEAAYMHYAGASMVKPVGITIHTRELLLLLFIAGLGSFASLMFLCHWSWQADLAASDLQPFPLGTTTSVPRIWCMMCSQIPYGFMIAGTIMTFPTEADHLLPDSPSFALGALFLITAVTMAFGPIGGQISDSLNHPFGRRRPAMLFGSQLIVLSTCGMWLCSLQRSLFGFCACLFVQQICFNVVSTVMMAVISDCVEHESVPVASGIQLANTFCGAISGVVSFKIIAANGWDYHLNYGLLNVLIICMLPTQMLATQEVDSRLFHLPPHLDWSQPVRAAISIYAFDLSEYPGFELILKERMWYYYGISIKSYTMYFIRDVLCVDSLAEQSSVMARTTVCAESTAAFVSVLVSHLFEHRKLDAQTVAVTGLCIMGLAGQFEIASLAHEKERKVQMFMALATIFSSSQALYLTGELAVVIQTLPRREEASKLLGLAFGLSTAVGGGIGSVCMALLLETFGKIIPEATGSKVKHGTYTLSGYVAVLLSILFSMWTSAGYLVSVTRDSPVDRKLEEFNDTPDFQPG